jgi:23S rRNA (adenine2503-C2)-methyltransferase
MGMEKRDFFDLSFEELAAELAPVEGRRFTARQIMRWAVKGAGGFAEMTDVSRPAREFLDSHFTLLPLEPVDKREAEGVTKFLYRLSDGPLVESVLIAEEGSEEGRNTLCLSSQAGCAMGCGYCETARGGLQRDLTSGEILAQVAAGIRHLGDRLQLRNLVLMGMGEPLVNLDAVIPALRRLLAPDGFAFSPRRVTVSTCGVVPGIERLGREGLGVGLAVSLNAADDAIRRRLMPVGGTYPLDELMAAVKGYPLTSRRRVTFTYVLLAGINDADADARRLAALVRGLRCKINLIPYNRTSGGYRRPPVDRVDGFARELMDAGLTVTVREGRGEEIGAACGQLRADRRREGDAGPEA